MKLKQEQRAAVRREQIFAAALALAAKHGYTNITRDAVAAEAGAAAGLVNRYFETMPQLRRAVIRHAVEQAGRNVVSGKKLDRDLLRVVAQGLAAKDKNAAKATDAVKKAALATLHA